MFGSFGHKRRATLGVLLLAVTFVGVFATSASAHDVTGIDVTCDALTVHFHDFPNPGVPVHIAVAVGAAPLITQDPVVSGGPDVVVDISAATTGLGGATVAVVVDVTWTNFGNQHVHDETTVTCGTGPTTSTTIADTTTMASTSTTMATTTTTTTMPTTTTTVAPIMGTHIFQVEFRKCRSLHIGYDHFRGGTVISFRVSQGGKLRDTGTFVTEPGKGYHFPSVMLAKHLSKHSHKAEVTFTWSVGARNFTYHAVRATGC